MSPLPERGRAWFPAHGECPTMTRLGRHGAVRFTARRLSRARILWLNPRWCLANGIDTSCADVRAQLEADLLRTFAVSVPDAQDPPEMYVPGERELFADRYGASGGAPHGGSGRCGYSGPLNAKGIGRTPLAAKNTDWEHTHGWLWMHEALREIVNAEVAAAELPHGAIPVVALIDVGVEIRGHGDAAKRRRAIIVRPNFLRPAHFERSIFFGDAGRPDSAQCRDAARTRDAIQAAGNAADGLDVTSMFMKFATQLGHAHALRLWQGRFLSSNLSACGALADFGSFRAVPDWRSAFGEPGASFGRELDEMRVALESLCFHFAKYAPVGTGATNARQILPLIAARLDDAFADACLPPLRDCAAADTDAARELAFVLRDYFRAQRAELVDIGAHRSTWRRPWLYHALLDSCPDTMLPPREVRLAKSVRALIAHAHRAEPAESARRASLAELCRWLRPRPTLYYEVAQRVATRLALRLRGDDADRARVGDYVARNISAARRQWSCVPPRATVVGQVSDCASSALYCHPHAGESALLHLECMATESGAHAFGTTLTHADIASVPHRRRGAQLVFDLPVARHPAPAASITIGSRQVRMPSAWSMAPRLAR